MPEPALHVTPATARCQSSAATGPSSAATGQSSAATCQSSAATGQSSAATCQSSAATGPSSVRHGPELGDVLAELWRALGEVEDPEIPVSVVDMGLIVALDWLPRMRTAQLKLTYTAMGCPAMDMIQDDIRARLLRVRGVEHVAIEVVWDPVWSPRRLSESARATMRELGIGV